MFEPEIGINGTKLTEIQAMTVRVAIDMFITLLQNKEDKYKNTPANLGYKKHLEYIDALIHRSD